MGILKSKADIAAQGASRAYAKGEQVFVYKFIEGMGGAAHSGSMGDVAEQIEGIEAAGWLLSNMSVGEEKTINGERIALVCIFRRRTRQADNPG